MTQGLLWTASKVVGRLLASLACELTSRKIYLVHLTVPENYSMLNTDMLKHFYH